MSRVVLLVLAVLMPAWWTESGLAAPLISSKVVQLPEYGFSVQLPSGWSVAIDKDGLPVFANFPWSKMQSQLRLPAKGAIINLVAWAKLPRRRGDDSLVGWSHLDDVRAVPGTVQSEVFRLPGETGISEAVLESFDEATYGPDDQAQREVSFYWTYRAGKFAAHLFYLVGDPRGSSYEDTLKRIVASVRPL